MKTLELKDAKNSLADYARSAARDPVIVLSRGKPLAALVSLKGADLETAAVSVSPVFQKIIRRSRRRQAREGGLSPSQVRQALGLKPKVTGTRAKPD
jgi:prevent-host-death family protein